jgi:hypothetical protein
MSRKPRSNTISTHELPQWTESECERREEVEGGGTVLANIKIDKQLIAWAESKKLYVRIGRPGDWGNPYVVGEDGDRPTCIASFRVYFLRKRGLHERLGELKGKVLGCYCYPEACHGHELIEFIRERPNPNEQVDT